MVCTGVKAFHQMPLDEKNVRMLSFIYMGKAFLRCSNRAEILAASDEYRDDKQLVRKRVRAVPASGMTDGSGMTHGECRGARIVRLMPTVWAH